MKVRGSSLALVLEDEALIAIYVEDLLEQAGLESIISCSSCAGAKIWLAGNTPGVAVIETRLIDGPCDDIAVILEERGIPYLVHSADLMRSPFWAKQKNWIEKPCDPDDFVRSVKECMTPS